MSSKVSPHSSSTLGNSGGSSSKNNSGTSTSTSVVVPTGPAPPRRQNQQQPTNRPTTTTTGGVTSSNSSTTVTNATVTTAPHPHPHPHHHKLGGKKRKTAGGGAKLRIGLGIPSPATTANVTANTTAAELAGRLTLETNATTLPAPPSSPVPPEEEEDLDGDLDIEEIDVEFEGDDVLGEEEEEDSEDLGEEEEEDEEDDDEEELVGSGAPPSSVTHRRPHHLHHPPRSANASGGGPENADYNSPIFLGSSSDDEDDDEDDEDDEDEDGGEVDESLERDESEEEDDEDDDGLEPQEFLLPSDGDASIQGIPPDAQQRLSSFFEAAGFTDGKAMSDPESLRKLTLTVSSALGEASAAINRMRDSQRKSIEEGRNDSMEEGDSLLALACSSGYFELARVLLAMGANVDDRGSKGDLTPLMDAASQGHLEIVRLLISHGADVNAQSACGNSPLMYSCAAGHEDVVLDLLKSGANVEDNNENGHTPLMESASAGHVGVAKILLEHGAGINTHSNEFKESALTVACYKGHLDMVRFLLDAGADQQHKTDEMHTALMEASMDGHVEVARLLLDSGAQVNMPADSFESPLTLAACGGHVDLAELLVERGANIEEVNDEGYTPLMEASREGHIAVVQSLLRNGALINAQTEETHETALTLGACGGFLDVVDTLCKSGADIELGASTPLMEASQEGHLQVVKYLLERGVDIHRQTQSGDTALSYSCENGHLEVAELLVEMGANPEHLSEGGRTPIMKACRGGHVEVIKFLLEKGAEVNRQTTSNDHTSLSLACAGGHIACVELLLAAGANPYQKLKDNSTMIIEAARGGHTAVIRALLDYAPPNTGKGQANAANAEKSQQGGKQIVGKPGTAGGKNQKAVVPDSTKAGPNQAASAKNVMSVLRKSRSTSTLDSGPPQQNKESLGTVEGKTKTALQQQPLVEQPSAIPKDNSGKIVNTSDASQEKPLLSQNLPASKPLDKKAGLTVTDGAVQGQSVAKDTSSTSGFPVSKSSTDTSGTNESSQALCTECTKGTESQVQVITSVAAGAGQTHVKRPAGTEPLLGSGTAPVIGASSGTTPTTPGVIIPVLAPMSTAAVPVGPPLVPSQVTAATAISERPKAKANKPSARKQVQLQQQGQGGNSTATSPGGASDKSQTSPTGSPSSASSGLSPGVVANSASSSAPTSPGNIKVSQASPNSNSTNPSLSPTVNGPSAFVQMQVKQVRAHPLPLNNTHLKLDPKQLTQVLTQQHQQYMSARQDKAKSSGNGQGSVGPNGTGGSAVNNPLTTTSTTTTVVVTHGNGEMETIIEGDNLISGANEMIMTAAAAAFPLECFGLPPSVQAGLQTYLDSPSSELATGPVTTATLQTTTIINSAAANFSPQMLLPHPPPLPAAIAAAAAAAGVVPPSGAPPPGVLKGVPGLGMGVQNKGKDLPLVPTPTSQKTVGGAAARTGAPTQSAPVQVPVPPVASVAGIQPAKKQLAKRSRPFGQPSQGAQQPRQSNQQTQTHQHTHGHTHQMKQNQSVASTQTTLTGQHADKAAEKNSGVLLKHFDVDCSTESGGETSLSVAAAAGHLETVEFLLARKAHIEHRDKKGCTPIILAADAGYDKVVELLITHGSDIEAQSERTKDTALSLACTKGRFEVVELLLKKGANKEHRNVSDYTPLSLAASGGYVNVIKLLLQHGAEINSRTGSKLGISPLMLAAMNGNTAAVKLLLDMGSDINAQIETNKNTALTLACFQGRHEVVSLLLDRKANLEHRAKTGLTPLMEAANGGYTEVGKTLLDRGADVNAAPVPATKDTALTIAADKGHYRFVELLLQRGAMVEVRNKKGCTPIWLACHGGHADVVQILFRHGADLDVQDNRKVSCLMAAFRKGHVKVIRWVVKNVQQFPSDVEMVRYYASIQSEADLLKRCQQCAEFVKQAKDKQALEANKNASILLEELDMEKSREELKRQAAARRREKKKKKKQEKKRGSGSKDDDDDDDNDDDDPEALQEDDEDECANVIDSGIDANSLGSNSSGAELRNGANRNKNNKENLSHDIHEPEALPEAATVTLSSARHRKKKNKKKDKSILPPQIPEESPLEMQKRKDILREKDNKIAAILEEAAVNSQAKVRDKRIKKEAEEFLTSYVGGLKVVQSNTGVPTTMSFPSSKKVLKSSPGSSDSTQSTNSSVTNTYHHPEPLMGISLNPSHLRKAGAANFDSHHDMASHSQHHNFQISYASSTKLGVGNSVPTTGSQSGSGKGGRKDDGWKEVTRNCPSSRSKKVIVPSSVISRVIGRGGCNINAIREATGAHIEVEKQQKGQVQPERTIQIKGSADSTKQAHTLITNLMNEPDLDIKKLLAQCMSASTWTGTQPLTSTTSTIPSTTRAQTTTASQPPLSQESNQPVSLVQIAGAVAAGGGKTKPISSKIPASPPSLTSVSPPIRKPSTPVQGTANVFKGTNTSGVVKKSLVFTPSSNAVTATTTCSLKNSQTSFASKLVQQQQATPTNQTSSAGGNGVTTQQHQQQRNTTPTPTKAATPPFSTSRSTPTSTPPPLSSSPGLTSGSVHMNMNMSSNQIFGKTTVRPIAPPGPVQQQGKERLCNQMTGNDKTFAGQATQQPTLITNANTSLTPPAQGISAPGNPTNFQSRAPTECRTDDESPQITHQTPPLEYSPFSYHFSKAAPWFPSDLGHNMLNENSSGMHTGPGSSLGQLGSASNPNLLTGNSSAARAMNFASVAASGISTTTTAQMTQAGGIHNGMMGPGVPNLGIAPIGSTTNLKNGGDSMLDNDMQKVQADASKAPGYRGSNMGSPVLRMQQQPQVQSVPPIGNFGMENSISSHYSTPQSGLGNLSQCGAPNLLGFNPTSSPRHINMNSHTGVGSGFGLGLVHQSQQQEMQNPNVGVSQQQQHFANSGGLSGPPPTTIVSTGVPTNVVISSRLNPRAPSFQLAQQPKMNLVGGQPQQQPNVSNYQQPGQQQQQQPYNSMHQTMQQHPSFKMCQLNQYGGRSNNNMVVGGRQPGGTGMNMGTGWNSYSQDASMFDLASLSGNSGAIDPQVLLSGMENSLHDNQNALKGSDRRLPRAIGEERSWKNTGTTNMGPFGSLECLEQSPMSQGAFQQSQVQAAQHQQASNWMGLGMYGGSNPQQFPGSNMTQPPPHVNVNNTHAPLPQRGNDTRGFLGRRFLDEMDQNRMLELQQMYDGRIMNGGGVPPALMHIAPGAQPYPFGLETEHPSQHLPKVDQHNNSWGDNSHLLMDDKHNMGWGTKWGN